GGCGARQLHAARGRPRPLDVAPPVEARREMTNGPVQRLQCGAGEGPIAGDLPAARDDIAYHALPATVRAVHQPAEGRRRGRGSLVPRITDLPGRLGDAAHVRTTPLATLLAITEAPRVSSARGGGDVMTEAGRGPRSPTRAFTWDGGADALHLTLSHVVLRHADAYLSNVIEQRRDQVAHHEGAPVKESGPSLLGAQQVVDGGSRGE